MTREEYVATFIKFIEVHSKMWLPEESTEEFMNKTMFSNIISHEKTINGFVKNGNNHLDMGDS